MSHRWSSRWRRIVAVVLSLALWPVAQAGTWDSLLSDSNWYVPQENLLAYMSSGTSFTTPPPIVLWDQTLWSLGTAENGRFTGSMQATFVVSPDVSFGSSMSILGLATEFGQIRMRFTPTDGGSPVIGIGQFRQVNGTTAMQMQMISGQAGEAYTTHWAYMLPYTPGSFTPPDPQPNSDLTSTEWAWTLGTTWAYQSDQLFGPGGAGSFTITNYRNGYFWGSGSGPAGTPGESFTQLGSITPEGNVLFNVLTGQSTPTLLTLTGQITGGPLTGQMALRTYEFTGSDPAFGAEGIAVVVPEPATWVMAFAGVAAAAAAMGFWPRTVSPIPFRGTSGSRLAWSRSARALPDPRRIDLVADVFGVQLLECGQQARLGIRCPHPEHVGVFRGPHVAVKTHRMSADDEEWHAMPGEDFKESEVRCHGRSAHRAVKWLEPCSSGGGNGRGPADFAGAQPTIAR